jgi:hypothetical protein
MHPHGAAPQEVDEYSEDYSLFCTSGQPPGRVSAALALCVAA